jgi:hypothetical protein
MNSYKDNNNYNDNFDNAIYLVDDNSNFTRQEVIDRCSSIFYNFSKCDKNDKNFYINSSNIKKIFKIVNLIDDKTLKSSDIDLLIKKINPNVNKLTEKNFLDLIVSIAARIYPKDYKKNPKNTIDNLISTFLEPFSKHIDDKNIDLNDAIKMPFIHRSLELLINKFLIDYKLIALVNNILYSIKEIYKNYFSLENHNIKDYQKILSNSQNDLIEFCKDFQISPYMISQEQLVIYFNLIVKIDIKNLTNNNLFDGEEIGNKNENYIIDPKKDMGTVFTLSRLCASLIHFSIFSYSKNNQMNLNNINDSEKFLLFLEKLENSKGFLNFQKKSNKPHTTNFSLIPKKSVLKLIDSDLLNAYDYFSDEESISSNNNNNTTYLNNNNNSTTYLNNNNNNYNYNQNQGRKIISIEKFLKDYDDLVKNNQEIDLKSLMNLNDENFQNLINNKMDFLKELFSSYAKLGDKFSPVKLTFSSFLKFFKDCNLIINEKDRENNLRKLKNNSTNIDYNSKLLNLSKTPSKINKENLLNTFSKSPIPNIRSSLKKENTAIGNSALKKNNNNNNNININNSNDDLKKLKESDVNIIYSILMGNKNGKFFLIFYLHLKLFLLIFNNINLLT